MKVLYPLRQENIPENQRIVESKMEKLRKIADVDNSFHPKSKNAWIKKLKNTNVIVNVGHPWNWEEFLDAAPILGMIQNAYVGYGNINIPACTKRGILVCNIPEDMSEAVAQHTLALILDLSKKVTKIDKTIRKNRGWDPNFDRIGFELWEKTLGVIGLGNIGGRLAIKCRQAFNMRVLAYDPHLVQSAAQRYGAKLVDLTTLIEESDVISVNCYLTKTGSNPTHHLIGSKQFDKMKKTAIIVNASRGTVIDEKAMINALKKQKIFGAGLDVFEKEPLSPDNPLIDMENVVLTAHQASSAIEALIRTKLSAIENVIKFVQGQKPNFIRNIAALFVKK
jgi:lactate dehydrogenase-like 2-hydroxyacid dehydrogenase